MAIDSQNKAFLALILRSEDQGEGWRSVNPRLWRLVVEFPHPELLEQDEPNFKVRLSHEGQIVAKHLL